MKNNVIRTEVKHLGLLILDLAILVMCVVFICSAITVAVSFHEAYDVGYDSDAMYYRLRDGNYARLAEMTWENRMHGRDDDADSQEYYAVADYYEAAVQYGICREEGDADGAERWLEKMKDAEGRMGVFASEREKIDEILGIQ